MLCCLFHDSIVDFALTNVSCVALLCYPLHLLNECICPTPSRKIDPLQGVQQILYKSSELSQKAKLSHTSIYDPASPEAAAYGTSTPVGRGPYPAPVPLATGPSSSPPVTLHQPNIQSQGERATLPLQYLSKKVGTAPVSNTCGHLSSIQATIALSRLVEEQTSDEDAVMPLEEDGVESRFMHASCGMVSNWTI